MAGASSEGAPRAWLDVQIGDRQPGRLVFELKWDAAPRACANFAALCTGERGYSTTSRLRLHYKGNKIHRLIPGFMLQMGDISPANDGTGGESIYGARFADEAGGLKQKHSARGTLAMANSGKDTNGSQVYVTFAATPWLDGRHVVFGRLIEGEATLAAMERVVTGAQDRPRIPVVIVDCGMTGEYKPMPAAGSAAGAAAGAGPTWTAGGAASEEPVARAVEDLRGLGGESRRGVRIERVLDGAGLPARFGGGASSKRRALAAASAADGADGAEDGAGRSAAPASEGVAAEAELAQFIRQRIGGSSGSGAGGSSGSGPSLGWASAVVPEAEAEADDEPADAEAAADGGDGEGEGDEAGGAGEGEAGDTSGLNSDTKDRLFALRMRLNAGRKANHNAVVYEHRKLEAAAQARPSAELRAANAVLKGAEAGGAKKKASVMAGQKPIASEEALIPADAALPSARTDGTAFGAGAGGGRKRDGGAAAGGARAGDKDDDEDESSASGVGAKRRRPASHEEGAEGAEGEAEPAPAPMAPAYMFEPASVAQAKAARRDEKERHRLENYGWNAHATNADAQVSFHVSCCCCGPCTILLRSEAGCPALVLASLPIPPASLYLASLLSFISFSRALCLVVCCSTARTRGHLLCCQKAALALATMPQLAAQASTLQQQAQAHPAPSPSPTAARTTSTQRAWSASHPPWRSRRRSARPSIASAPAWQTRRAGISPARTACSMRGWRRTWAATAPT